MLNSAHSFYENEMNRINQVANNLEEPPSGEDDLTSPSSGSGKTSNDGKPEANTALRASMET